MDLISCPGKGWSGEEYRVSVHCWLALPPADLMQLRSYPVDAQTKSSPFVAALGVGAFTQGVLSALKADGARVATYLTRDYAHHGPGLVGPVFDSALEPNPCPIFRTDRPDLVLPMSIEWRRSPWADEFLTLGIPFLCPTGAGLDLELDRDFARRLCQRFGVAFPTAFVARDQAEAEALVRQHGKPFVLKNPRCGPSTPIHTIVCETVEDTLGWLPRLDYADGVFLQEYLGRAEAGHIALVSAGEIHSLVTNQEYKRAFDGDMGVVAGAPMGGLIERDPEDRHGLCRDLLRPLLPWFREVDFHGPVQVTAIRHGGRWHVLEYNVRLGITSGPMICRMLANPLETLMACARNEPLSPQWREGRRFGCSVTLAGYGYPFTKMEGPRVPVVRRPAILVRPETAKNLPGKDTEVLWNEVALSEAGELEATGHRLCDVASLAPTLSAAIAATYAEIGQWRSLGSYFRRDVGQSLWPPGVGAAGPRVETVPVRAAWIEIDHAQLQRNFEAIVERARESNPDQPAQILFVVKDDGFGHGAVQTSHTALASGASRLAVATVGEALELRQGGIDAPILVYGERSPDELVECLKHGLTVCVNELATPTLLGKLAMELGMKARVHLKMSTGMNRHGVDWESVAEIGAAVGRIPGIEIEGVFSHFVMADAADHTVSLEQVERFRQAVGRLKNAGVRPVLRHLCNSGGFLNFPQAHFDMVRLGILPLGWYPSDDLPEVHGLAPIMSVKARVALVREIAAGQTVGYGRRYRAEKTRRIAVLPIGFGDGYPRLLNTGCVLLHGRRVPIRGGVTMDAIMVDVTDLPEVVAGDEAVLMGGQGGEQISVHELAGAANTVSYDILVRWSSRMERIHLR
jgi:alanine racemase